MSLIVENLSCARGGRTLFTGLSLRADPGAFIALRGPNGAGKSTLLRALAGLSPSRGIIRWGETSLAEDADAYQEKLLYAGHLDAVKPALTVDENLSFWAELHDASAEALESAMARFRLKALASIPAGQCSAGQKRRLGLARLVVTERPVWLLDEPTVSLDAESARDFAGTVSAHCAAGGVVIAATHIELGVEGGRELWLDRFAAVPAKDGLEAADDPFLDPAFERENIT